MPFVGVVVVMKRRRDASTADAATTEAIALTSARGIKAWRAPTAGAAEEGGKFVHSWNEHRNSKSFKQGKWTAVEELKLLELFDEYCAIHSLEGEARLRPLVETAKGSPEQDVWRFCVSSVAHLGVLLLTL